MKKIGELNAKAMHIVIYYDEKAKRDPYRVYRRFMAYNDKLYLTEHKQMVCKYANLASCTAWIAQYIQDHDEFARG